MSVAPAVSAASSSNLTGAWAESRGKQQERTLARGPVLLAAMLLSPLALVTANGLLTLASVWALVAIILLLFRFGEPPVLIFAVTLQWLSVSSPLFTADVQQQVLGTSTGSTTMDDAAWLGLAALVVLALGMRVGRGGQKLWSLNELRLAGKALAPLRLTLIYVGILLFVVAVVPLLIRLVPGLGQQLLKLNTLPTLIAFLVVWAATVNRSARLLAGLVVVANVLVGFGGYFSGFKDILLLAVVVVSMNAPSLRRLLVNPAVILLSTATLVLVAFWSFIKPDYRAFVNGGTRQQVVTVSSDARIEYLKNAAASFTPADLGTGLELALDRIGYLTFLSGAIESVPSRIPHQNGRLWREAVQHVLMPRAFFPGKPAIDDSDRTNEFTGFQVADADDGASISIGYVGESYIDFGPVGMFVPILLLGLLWGWGYRLLCQTGPVPLLSVSAATVFVLSGAQYFEASNVKLVGGALALLPILYVVLRVVGGKLWQLLTGDVQVQQDGALYQAHRTGNTRVPV